MRLVILALVLVPPVVLFGGVHPQTQTWLLLSYTALFAIVVAHRLQRRRAFVWHPLVLLTGSLAAAASVQLVPLPHRWLEVVSPVTADAVGRVDAIFGYAAGAAPVTLDHTATLQAAGRWWLVTLGLLAALQVIRARRWRRQTSGLLLGLAGFVLVVALIQSVVGADRVYGLLKPRHVNALVGPGGPFINPNHASHFLLLAASVCLWLIATSPMKPSWLLPGVFALCVVGILANGSRGALLAIALAAPLFALRRGRDSGRQTKVLAALAAAFGLGAFLALGSGAVRQFFDLGELRGQLDWNKVALWEVGWKLVQRFPWTGIGADALGAVPSLAPAGPAASHLSYVENDYLQILVDFGLLVPAVAVGWVVAVARARPPRRPDRSGAAWLVLLPFALYSVVSFAAPVPALILWAATTFIVLGGGFRSLRSRRLHFGLVFAIGVASLAMLGALLRHPYRPDSPLRADLHSWARSAPLDGRRLWGAAVVGFDVLDRTAVDALAERAAELAGADRSLLEALARYWLQRDQLGRAGALIERVADRQGRVGRWLDDWVDTTHDPVRLARLCGSAPSQRARILDRLMRLDRAGDALSVSLDLPDTPVALVFRIRASQTLGETDLVRGFTDRLRRSSRPATVDDCTWTARGLAAGGDPQRALDLLATCAQRWPDDEGILLLFVRWALDRPERAETRRDRIDAYLERLNALTADSSRARRSYYHLLAMAQARDGYCRAASRSLELTGRPGGQPPALPRWIAERCPELTPE